MTLSSTSFQDGQPIDPSYAFCRPTGGSDHTTDGGNRSPHLAWSGAPAGTRSFAVVMHDPDVPADASDANTEGKTIPERRRAHDVLPLAAGRRPGPNDRG